MRVFTRISYLVFFCLVSLEVLGFALPMPGGFRVQMESHNSVRLVWSYSGESPDSFVIERKTGTGSFSQLTTVGGSALGFTNVGLVEGTYYTYRVRVKKGAVYSGYTEERKIYIPLKKDFVPSALSYRKGVGQAMEPIEDLYSWESLALNTNYDVFQTPPCLEGEYYIGFELGYDLGDFATESSWKADLELVFLQGTTVLWTKPVGLNSSAGTWTGTVFHDVSLSCMSDYKFKIQSKTSQGTVPVGRVTLKKRLFRKVGNTFSSSLAPTSLTAAYSSGQMTLGWSYGNAEFREFDLEWVFVSSYATQVSTASAAFGQEESVRVRVSGSAYVHRVYYPSGKLYYRVRAVGYHPDYPERKLLGAWVYGSNSGTSVSSSSTTTKNWQRRTDYIEGGKYRQQVGYFDGTLRSRQEVSSRNTENYVSVSETWYDYEGRPTLSFLPGVEASAGLGFRANYNRFNSSTSSPIYAEVVGTTRIKYHYDNGSVANNTISTGYGAGKYYSSGNGTASVNKAYIPNASGYPYVLSEYMNDPTGRLRKQGQMGSGLRIDGSYATKMYYGQAFPEELIRLFGMNVGDAVHYRKEVTVDPNGQASVSYIDQEGRIVATALAGNLPGGSRYTALPEYTSKESSGWGSVSYDLSSHNKREGEGMVVGASFVNMTANTTHAFTYSLSGIGSDLDQLGCQSCGLDLSIRLLDPDGVWVDLPQTAGDESTDIKEYTRTFTATDCQVDQAFSPVTLNVILAKVGEYRVVKRLEAKEKTLETVLALIRTDTEYVSQKEALENTFETDAASCEWCMEECPEAEEAVVLSIEELVSQEEASILEQIRQELLGAQPGLTEAQLTAALANHEDYCEYELLVATRDSRVWEYRLSLIRSWEEYQGLGTALLESDPLYNGGIGSSKKGALGTRLASMAQGNFTGSLDNLTDPAKVAYKVDALGQPSSSGYHFLYYDLLSSQGTMPTQEFNQRMSERRWTLYSSLYLNASREVKNTISQFAGCQAYADKTAVFNANPTEQDIQNFMQSTGVLEPVSEEELDQLVLRITNGGNCQVTFTAGEETTIRESLRAYLNSNRQGNMFNLILEEDLNSSHLAPLKNLLTSKSCSLASYAIQNPLTCLTDTVLVLPIKPTNPGDACYKDPGIYRLQPTEFEQEKQLKEFKDKNKERQKEEAYLDSLLWIKMMQQADQITPMVKNKPNHQQGKVIGETKSNRGRTGIQTRSSLQSSSSSLANAKVLAPSPSAAEYQALMDFYQAMGGPNWNNKTGWSTANPNVVQDVSGFHGVTVDANGHVKFLILYQNNLNGTIPESFGNLSYLEHIQLVRNPFIGQLPQSIGNLNKVKELILYSNNMTGSLPNTIGSMSALENVHLYVNNLTGSIPTSITNLANLRFFSVYDNDVSGTLPSDLGNLSKLTHFYINGNSITGPIPQSIGNLAQAKELYLYSNQLSGNIPTSMGNLSELTNLYLNGNQLTGSIPSSFGSLKKLVFLWMQDNQLSGQIPGTMGGMSQLNSFYGQRNNFSGVLPNSFGNLSNLWRLRLDENKIKSRIPDSFGNLLNLRDLILSNNQLFGVIPPGICSLPYLNILELHDNSLEGDIPNCLYDKNMYSFTVRYNNYLWENLTYAKQKVGDYYMYGPQYLKGVQDSLYVLPNAQIVLTAEDGNYAGTPSTYRWRKNGVPLHDASTANRSITINCNPTPGAPCNSGCEGSYTVEIRNADFPGPYIEGRGARIEMLPGQTVTVCTSYELDPAFNPWLGNVSVEVPMSSLIASCMAYQDTVRQKVRSAAVSQLEKTWLESYYDSRTTQCLDGAKESLSMTVTNKEYHYTLYYYDQSGNLAQTVPPKGVKPLSSAQVSQVKSGTSINPSHELLTQYKYNSKNQLVWQSSPDGGVSEFWYNAVGQLRLSRNAKQAAANAYSYSRYDALGRVVETGELVTTEALTSLKGKLNTLSFPERPAYSCQDITLTGYDRAKTGVSPYLTQENLRGRVSWTGQLEKGKTDTLMTVYSYDPHGNVKSLLQRIPGMEPKLTEYQYDLLSGNVNYVSYQPGTSEQLVHRYRYDADNRLETVQTSTDGHVWSTDATYYYYPHGPLARVELGEHKVQGLDYYYTLQGWLKGVNMPGGGDPGGDGTGTKRTGKDAMAFALGYFSGDYSPITSGTVLTDTRDLLWTRTSTINTNSGLYNGNITWMNTELPGSSDAYAMQAMVYKYDQLNRLVQARSLREYTTGSGFNTRTAATAKAYDGTYTYDGNGNLLTLQRRDASAGLQDNFTYGYYANSNKLRQTASAQGDNYVYDQIGNLTKDVAGGVTNIEWTPSGKLRKVTKSTGSPIEFRYDASGNRVEKKQGTTITRYIRDASGNVMAVYQADTLSERPIYGSSRLGNLGYASKPGYRTVGYKQYELSNHLGNVLAVVSDRIHMDSQNTWAEVLSRSDYYPFGLEMTGRTESNGYRYGFNGKEKDPSGEWSNQSHYDYGFRIYNPTIGKFLSVDPLAQMRVSLTPYNFVSNNPIFRIDPSGALDYPIYGKDGTYLGDDGRTGGDLAFIGERDGKGGFKNLTQFTDNHTQFQTISNIVRQEGTTSESKEYLWIAHTANNAANASGKSLYGKLMSGYSSVDKSNKTTLSVTNNSNTAKFARAGVMDVLSGGSDPTGGAQFWDGTDFLAWGLNSPNGTPQNKFEEYSAIFIDVMTFNEYEASQKAKWGNSVRYGSKSYNIPAEVFSIIKNPSNWGTYRRSTTGGTFGFYYNTGNKGGILNATGTAGESIFWRVDK